MQGIADYEFLRSLGWGNLGQCFLARRPPRLPVDAEFCVVKVLACESTADTFRRAAGLLRACAHIHSPYLVALYDTGQHDGVFYYAMEYLSEGSLAKPTHPVRGQAAVRAVADVAQAAASMHSAGLVHGAIKPGNVLLTTVGAKLADPGLAPAFRPGITVTGRGSAASLEFTDPAVLDGEVPGPAADVWSLGALLHRAVAGRGVYGDVPEGDGLFALRWVMDTRPALTSALPGPVAEIVRDCLVPAAHRPSAAVVADRLAALSVPDASSRAEPDGSSRAEGVG
jgi:eukaryotic-like serine/threonine-protein kinase